ncbi:peptidase S8/S53 domain-containing protein [Fomitopsis serialis]|uniref:peptidase S8/S53 domain-containing protein n=1 Tax=Fomitopsis serialis TaxID=139415 RepID=UPI0020084A8D|nr:peptidase S8/S53 domain-containing protein [Neoantrodia serialis]KAH9913299.1 peptidase S8/S53 domain-containing protein [Neoantrodia serialis]
MLTSSFLLGLLLPALSATGAPSTSLQVHESRVDPPSGYTLTGPATPDTVLTLRLALAQGNSSGLVDALYDVSTPSSPNYGAYLSKEQVQAHLAPTNESASAVNLWLNESGLQATALSAAGDWLSVQLPVSTANELLDANFSVFTHSSTGEQTIRTLAYSIPTALTDHLDLVHPTVSFPNPGNSAPLTSVPPLQLSVDADTGPCNVSLITPECLQWLYDIPTTPATHGVQLAVPGYSAEWPQEAYLKAFLEKYRPDIDSNTTWELVTLDGGYDPQNSSSISTEGNLDMQWTLGVATNVSVRFISVSNVTVPTEDEFAGWLLDTAHYMLGLDDPPQVMSTSYGVNEEMVSEKLAQNLCTAYAGLGARGVSVLFGSGDGGVAGIHYPDDTCTTFIPTFPGGVPIGGTYLVPETAADFSGGGFSSVFARPAYQASAVAGYLDYLGDANAGLYNASGRAFPDVAAYSVNFDVVYGGAEGPINGTSCAGPTFANVISLLNDELIAAGRPVLGFLNPWLYSMAKSALTDVTVGNNYACSNFTTGFNATVGWDAVTGLGTPNYPKLKAVLGL